MDIQHAEFRYSESHFILLCGGQFAKFHFAECHHAKGYYDAEWHYEVLLWWVS
jgi:hypothetical protein